VLDDQRPTRRQPHLPVEGLVELRKPYFPYLNSNALRSQPSKNFKSLGRLLANVA
jgi:hypothetical protein